jgi:hypothetical protein
MKGIQVIPTIFYVAIFIIILFVVGALIATFPGIEKRILNLLRQWFGLPIEDIAVLYHFDEGTGTCVEDSSNHGTLGKLNGRDCGGDSDMWVLDKKDIMVGSGAIRFKNNDYVEAKYSSEIGGKMLNMENVEGMTIDFWLKVVGSHGDIYLLYKGNSMNDCLNGRANYCLKLTGDDKIEFKIKIKNIGYCSLTSNRLTTGYNHIAVTYENKTGKVKFYIQGRVDREAECHSGIIASSNPYDAPLYVGCKDTACPEALDAQGNEIGGLYMDELRIYTRAISPEEVVMHFQAIY